VEAGDYSVELLAPEIATGLDYCSRDCSIPSEIARNCEREKERERETDRRKLASGQIAGCELVVIGSKS